MKENEDIKQIYFERVYDNIKTKGYHTTAVAEEKDFTPFAYSTGIFENFKIPEIFISGLGPNLSGQIIDNYVDKYQFKEVPLNQKINDLIDTFPVFFLPVNNIDLTEYVLTSVKFYESRKYEYIQIVFPDLNGHFPNSAEYEYDQKIIGNFNI
ncbi:DUF4262 domain-containing protein [Flavobacterium gelatinilyticum]|uniref:DUF4262 domain-containing protein n=1 Tax=Flavobacterium gelatinilyticum TaxID=3003260 RepID=UPI00248105CD|nr:DUF4262 domain-containing protein [Flavobacterium gelatinilyticum]